MPCNYNHLQYGHADQVPTSPECVADHEAQKAYLGNMKMMVYINDQLFRQK